MKDLWSFFSNPSFLGLVQAGTLVALAWTLKVFFGYARDTRRTADAAELQHHMQFRPCLAVGKLGRRDGMDLAWDQASVELADRGEPFHPGETPGRPSAVELPADCMLSNIGIGPAFEIEVRKVNAKGERALRLFLPHLRASQGAPIGHAVTWGDDEVWKLEIKYFGVSGARFVSLYSLEGSVVRAFETRLREGPAA